MALELPPAAPGHPASHGSSVLCVSLCTGHAHFQLRLLPCRCGWAWDVLCGKSGLGLFGVLGVDQLALACHGDVEVAVMEMAAAWAAVVVMAI